MENHKDKKGLLKSAGLIAGLTMASRIMGLVRDMLCANVFGTSRIWDAFLAAFAIPNFLRRVVGEGALANAFIPTYTEIREKEGVEAANRLANTLLTFLLVVLGGLSLAVIMGSQALIAWGKLPEKAVLVLHFLQIMFPYIIFLSEAALFMGILHSNRKFFAPAFSPILLNLIWVGTVAVIFPLLDGELYYKATFLAWAILFSGFLQEMAHLLPLYRMGYQVRLLFDFTHPAMRKIFSLVIPAVLGFAVVQVSMLVDMTCAFFLGDGANAALWYGNRLMQLPLGVFGIAMSSAVFPLFAQLAAKEDLKAIGYTLQFSTRSLFAIVVPATFGLVFLSQPIVSVLFERGAFNAESTARCTGVLWGYSLGLFAFAGQKVVGSAFYALKDPKTPFRVSSMAVGLNIILNLILMQFMQETGLALATSISGLFNFFFLIWLFKKRNPVFEAGIIFRSLLQISALSLVMGIGARLLYDHGPFTAFPGAARLAAVIFCALLFYLFLGWFFRVEEIRSAFRLFLKKEKPLPANGN